jgi:hypothetical protein
MKTILVVILTVLSLFGCASADRILDGDVGSQPIQIERPIVETPEEEPVEEIVIPEVIVVPKMDYEGRESTEDSKIRRRMDLKAGVYENEFGDPTVKTEDGDPYFVDPSNGKTYYLYHIDGEYYYD